jgi:hypothetical protein
MILNPKARVAHNALVHSRGISVCRRAYRRANSGADRKFWYTWESSLQEKIVSCANMLIRISSVQDKLHCN